MNVDKKWMILILFLLGAMAASGCAVSKDTIMAYNDAKDSFQKATLAGAKKCAPVPYATAEAYLAHADHEIAERDPWRDTHLQNAIKTTKDKSLEAMKICGTPPRPQPGAAAPGAPAAPTRPAAPPVAAPSPPAISPPPGRAAPPSLAPVTPKPAPPAVTPAPIVPPAAAAPPPPPPAAAPLPPPPPPPTAALRPPAAQAAPPPGQAVAPAKEPQFEPIYFDVNKTNISPTAAKALDQDGMLLRDNPRVKVEIGGYTDSSASEKANQALSEKRAQSAKKYLQDKFDIPGDRMTVKGYGSSKPIADNNTKEGRAKNRRVEFRIIK